MKKQIKNLILLVSIGVIAVFILFIINQTAQIVDLASRLSPILGTIVLYTLILVFLILAVLPVVMYRRLPKSLKVPENENSEEYEEYLLALTKRLQTNKYLLSQNVNVKTKDDLPHAINLLEDQANEDIKKTASVIFVTTAVSQSGKLDAFVVLIMLSKMVWRIGHIYNQRPRLKEMLHLYANVAGTAFIAMGLDEIDIGEQVDQILGNVIGPSAFGSLPGFEQVATFLTTAMIDGTANAYLTLTGWSHYEKLLRKPGKTKPKIIKKIRQYRGRGHFG